MTYMLTLYKITLYLQYVNITYYVILTYPFYCVGITKPKNVFALICYEI